jgi:Ca2+-binding RTX toxin-like protein
MVTLLPYAFSCYHYIVAAGTETGNGFENYVFGTMEGDTIVGKGGNDRFFGLAGADKISSGTGDDVLNGDDGKI